MIREKTIFRNFLFGAVLLAGTAFAVSCSVDEAAGVSDMNAISFKSVVATRAAATTVNNLNEFDVWGWKVDGSGNDLGTLMDGVVAAKDDAGTYYYPEKTYYWPGCEVEFLGISPAGVVTEETEGRFTSLNFAVPETADGQYDLLYAYTTGYDSGTVPMNFRHALTQVEFKALNTNSWMTVEIAGVSVAPVVKEGVLTLPTESTQGSTDGSYGTWTYETTETAAFAAGLPTEAVTVGSDATALTADGGSLFLIPEEVEAWEPTDANNANGGAYFLISCRITEFGVQLWPDPKGTETYAEIAIPCEIAWEQGRKYTYTFNFGEGAGYYPPTSDSSIAGTAILDGPISFDVEVGDVDGSAGNFDEDDEAETYVVVTTFAELTAAVSNNEHHILVAADIDISKEEYGHGVGIYTDCTIIIEDGCTITAPNSGSSSPYSAFYVEYINDDRGYPNLTIDGDGTIATTGDSAAAGTYCIYVREGSLTINSGTFKGGAWNVENYSGTDYCIYGYGYAGDVNVTINGGSFQTGSHSYDLYANLNSNYNITFTVNAGRFYMYDPSGYVSSGHTATQDSDGWYVVK